MCFASRESDFIYKSIDLDDLLLVDVLFAFAVVGFISISFPKK